MIVYDRLWKTMKQKGVTQYKLIKNYGFSTGQLDRLRKNNNVSTFTLNQLCTILDCGIDSIAEFKSDVAADSYRTDGDAAHMVAK